MLGKLKTLSGVGVRAFTMRLELSIGFSNILEKCVAKSSQMSALLLVV